MYTYRYRGHVFNCMVEVNVSPKLKTMKSYAVLSGRCTSGPGSTKKQKIIRFF